MTKGWDCPRCGSAHAPHVVTCPERAREHPGVLPTSGAEKSASDPVPFFRSNRAGYSLGAPISPEAVIALNNQQTGEGISPFDRLHPMTCPNRGDGNHGILNGDLGALFATRFAWICPFCNYRQPY